MPLALRSTRAALLLILAFAPVLFAQAPAAAEPAEILVLGTYHFSNPGLDVVKTEVADVLSETKQAEILAVVEGLARFRPTKIAVERLPEQAARLDDTYQEYRAGRHELTRNELEQVGFRLAARFDHPRLYPIDHDGEFPFPALMEYAQTHDPAFVAYAQEEIARITGEGNRRQRENTIGEVLRLMNAPEELAGGHGVYMRFAAVGAGDTFVGARLVSDWYERNIHIFSNLQRLAEPGDRILLVIGAGHAPILRELITYDPELLLVEPLAYLPPG